MKVALDLYDGAWYTERKFRDNISYIDKTIRIDHSPWELLTDLNKHGMHQPGNAQEIGVKTRCWGYLTYLHV